MRYILLRDAQFPDKFVNQIHVVSYAKEKIVYSCESLFMEIYIAFHTTSWHQPDWSILFTDQKRRRGYLPSALITKDLQKCWTK